MQRHFLIALSLFLLFSAQPRNVPRVMIDASVAPDFAELIRDTWWRFLGFFAERSDCFGDVRIVAVHTLADRADYDPASATVSVLVPERGSLLRAALVHEWAHHLEFQCPAQMELRPAFLAAQGNPPNTPWRAEHGSVNLPAYRWAAIPSEQYAETVAAAVLDNRALRTPVNITDNGIRVITAWARKETLP
ncbi:MAG: hypothetical protein U0350_35260 [Caldilineaceae bacterium]